MPNNGEKRYQRGVRKIELAKDRSAVPLVRRRKFRGNSKGGSLRKKEYHLRGQGRGRGGGGGWWRVLEQSSAGPCQERQKKKVGKQNLCKR